MPLFLCSAINRVAASAITSYKKKMPHIGGIKIIWITFRDRQHLPDTWLPAEHFPIRC